ncbi:MAG: hypothetical protein D6798_11315 [Deltaproteobacteria bacterium]|nr:MAG: hypothetical protein D6798_11315 [Deltaproteobacteria bacterium]
MDDLTLHLDVRVQMSGRSTTWTTEPMTVPAYEWVGASLGDLDDAFIDEAQRDWLSDLSVQVVLVNRAGVEILRQAAPPLKLAWDDHGPLLLTIDQAADLSVGGAWSIAAEIEAGDPITTGDSEFVADYGEVNP